MRNGLFSSPIVAAKRVWGCLGCSRRLQALVCVLLLSTVLLQLESVPWGRRRGSGRQSSPSPHDVLLVHKSRGEAHAVALHACARGRASWKLFAPCQEALATPNAAAAVCGSLRDNLGLGGGVARQGARHVRLQRPVGSFGDHVRAQGGLTTHLHDAYPRALLAHLTSGTLKLDRDRSPKYLMLQCHRGQMSNRLR